MLGQEVFAGNPFPTRSHSGSHGQTRRKVCRLNIRGKSSSLFFDIAYQTEGGSGPIFRRFLELFSLSFGLGAQKWVRASARKKAFGCRLRQAKRSAGPALGWVNGDGGSRLTKFSEAAEFGSHIKIFLDITTCV